MSTRPDVLKAELRKTNRIDPLVAFMGGNHTTSGTPQSDAEQPALPASAPANTYHVLGPNCQLYGPASLELLKEWVVEGCCASDSWVYIEKSNCWKRARYVAGLRALLSATTPVSWVNESGLSIAQLRRIRLFSNLADCEILDIVFYTRKVDIPALNPVARKGAHANSLYLLLRGEAEVLMVSEGATKGLMLLSTGDFFGESTLLEEGPSPVDVNTNMDCTFLCLRHSDFQRMVMEQPDLAVRFLTALLYHASFVRLATCERFAKSSLLIRESLKTTGGASGRGR